MLGISFSFSPYPPFIQNGADTKVSTLWLSEEAEELQMLRQCEGRFKWECDDPVLWQKFLPRYGCIILAYQSYEGPYGTVFLEVLGLDCYCLDMHYPGPTGDHSYTGTPTDHQALSVGQIEESTLHLVKERFNKLLAVASTLKGPDRRAGHARRGHQKTPGFIIAVLQQAINCKCWDGDGDWDGTCNCQKEILPIGGLLTMVSTREVRNATQVFLW